MKKSSGNYRCRQRIGYGIASKLAEEGKAIAIFDIIKREDVEDNISKLEDKGVPVIYYNGDLTSADDRENFIQKVMDEFGRIDILVNNAGVAPKVRRDILEMTEESFDFVIGVNIKGTLFMTQLVANIMVEEVENNPDINPVIINIASASSYATSTNRGEYCISKAGVSMITKLLQTDWLIKVYMSMRSGRGLYSLI